MVKFRKRLLRLVFQCHGEESRCFCIKGKPMSICARCTGLMIGYPTSIIVYLIYGFNPWTVLLIIPMSVDGFYQLLNKNYESNNLKRVTTGFLASFGIIYILYLCTLPLNQFTYYLLDLLDIPYNKL